MLTQVQMAQYGHSRSAVNKADVMAPQLLQGRKGSA